MLTYFITGAAHQLLQQHESTAARSRKPSDCGVLLRHHGVPGEGGAGGVLGELWGGAVYLGEGELRLSSWHPIHVRY